MTGATNAAAAAACSGALVATSIAMEEERKNTARRKSVMGIDQVVIETRKDIDRVGALIADIFENWVYDPKTESLYREPKQKIFSIASLVTMALSTLGVIFIAFFVYNAFDICGDAYSCFTKFPLDLTTSIVISIAIGILFGFIWHPDNTEIDDIRLTSIDKNGMKTRVLIKVYDNDGRRNYNQDTIMRIEETIV